MSHANKVKSANYMYKGFYPGIIQVLINRPIPYATRVGEEFSNPEILLQLRIDKDSLPDLTQYSKRFGSVHGEFGQRDVYYDISLMRGISMRINLRDMESNNPKMVMSPSSWRMMQMLEWVSRAYRYLLDVQTVALLKHGYCPLHCAAISKQGRAILIVAPSDTGKTCAAIRAAEYGYNMIAEERIIFDGNRLYPGVSVGAEAFSGLYLSKMKSGTSRKPLRRILLMGLRILGLDRLKRVTVKMSERIKVSRCEPEPLEISHVVFLEPGKNGVFPIAKEEAARRLHDNNKTEFTWRSNTVLRGYSYFNPDFDIRCLEKIEDSLLDRLLSYRSYICSAEDPYYYFEQVNKVASGDY